MGVRDLWSIISPVCEKKSLWELRGKIIAIDLSCWVCESQSISDRTSQPRMYLRNLFFRTMCLILLGVHPVFILEGKAPEMKQVTILRRQQQHRNKHMSSSQSQSQNTSRARLNSFLSNCRKLLSVMGLPALQSPGEAEAFCALLNQMKVVDGCVTQDGDCLLYGAETVYRNFSITGGGSTGFSVDVCKMSVIEEKLSLGRDELIAISLLCGCDYNEKGVSGVGKESVMKFLTGTKDKHILRRLRRWRTDPLYEERENIRSLVSKGTICEQCGHQGRKQRHNRNGCQECLTTEGCTQSPSHQFFCDEAAIAELNIRKKALADPEFPSEAIIKEFFQHEGVLTAPVTIECWKKPDILAFVKMAVKLLSWTETYAVQKFIPLVTRWQLIEIGRDAKCSKSNYPFAPQTIIKKRILKGIECYEIQWYDIWNELEDIEVDECSLPSLLVTVEPQNLVQGAYPDIVDKFISKTRPVAKKDKKGTRKKNLEKGKENIDPNEFGTQKRVDEYFGKKRTRPIGNTEKLFGNCVINSPTQEPLKKGFKLSSVENCGNSAKSSHKENICMQNLSENFLTLSMKSENKYLQESVVHRSVVTREITCEEKSQNECLCIESSDCEECALCVDSDSADYMNLSAIIDGIVNKKTVSCSNIDENLPKTEFISDQSGDEFDQLAEQKYIPLYERLRSQI